MSRFTWKHLMFTAGVAAQFACGGPASDTGEQPKGMALTDHAAVKRLDKAPLTKQVDVTALVSSGIHPFALPTLQANALYSEGTSGSVIQTSDGGYVFTGTTTSLGDEDILLVKTDAFMQVQWAYAYGTTNPDSGVEVRATSDGGFMIAGQTFQNNNFDFYVVRTNSTGQYYWQGPFGTTLQEYPNAMEVTPDDGCIIVGKTRSNLGYENASMMKFSATGTVQWNKSFSSGADGTYAFNGVANVPGGGYVAVGSRQVKVSTSTWQTYGYMARVSSTGSTVFAISLGYSAFLQAVAATSTGYVAVGYTDTGSAVGAEFYAARVNTTGGTVWAKSISGGTRGDYLNDVKVASDGNYVITGTIVPSDTQRNLHLMKLDTGGNMLWSYGPYPSTDVTSGQSLSVTQDGGFIVGGTYTNSMNTTYMLLTKFSP